jgi:hypothetical protein
VDRCRDHNCIEAGKIQCGRERGAVMDLGLVTTLPDARLSPLGDLSGLAFCCSVDDQDFHAMSSSWR